MGRDRIEALPENRRTREDGGSKSSADRPTPDPLAALENLHFDLGRIEALSFAALEALARVPRASTPEGRHAMRRLDHFVTLFAEEAVAVLANADGAVEEISRHLSADHPRR